jgi:hypothetical protein
MAAGEYHRRSKGRCASIDPYDVERALGPLVLRVDFPVSGENVSEADKRGAGPAGLAKIGSSEPIFDWGCFVGEGGAPRSESKSK